MSKTLEQKFSDLLVEVRQRADHYNSRRMETEKRCREMVDEAVAAATAVEIKRDDILASREAQRAALDNTNDSLTRMATLCRGLQKENNYLKDRLDRMEQSTERHSANAEQIEQRLRECVRQLYETVCGPEQVLETKATPLHHLDLPTRARNALLSDGIETIEQLCQHTGMELMKIPNFGKGSLREVIFVLHQNGLKLGMVTE